MIGGQENGQIPFVARRIRPGQHSQRLGYGQDDRLLIVNCDDLGSSHGANVATYRAAVYGVATSATMMVPCPWTREAAHV
jgi:hypothetical protein